MNNDYRALLASGTAIVLYDGVCNLCSGTVRFIFRRDPRGHFRFAALQSELGRRLREEKGLPADVLTTLVLLEGEAVFTRSDAFLQMVRHLRPLWPALGCLRVVPRRLRDAVYDFVARHRYRWFGRKTSCELPPPALRARFL